MIFGCMPPAAYENLQGNYFLMFFTIDAGDFTCLAGFFSFDVGDFTCLPGEREK